MNFKNGFIHDQWKLLSKLIIEQGKTNDFLANPRLILAELNYEIPKNVEVLAYQNHDTSIYFIMPQTSDLPINDDILQYFNAAVKVNTASSAATVGCLATFYCLSTDGGTVGTASTFTSASSVSSAGSQKFDKI